MQLDAFKTAGSSPPPRPVSYRLRTATLRLGESPTALIDPLEG
jgi:hypothetical protein